jgi:hypothetical protein
MTRYEGSSKMSIRVEKGCFDGLDDALDDIRKNRLWPTTYVAEEATAADIHWHSEEVTVYVMKGQTYFLDGETRKKHAVMEGDKVTVPARTLHAEGEVVGGIIYLIGIPEALSPERFLMQREPSELVGT